MRTNPLKQLNGIFRSWMPELPKREIKECCEFSHHPEDFGSFYAAQGWLKERGYSWGSLAVTKSDFVAVCKGEYIFPQKWHNISEEGRQRVDGVIHSIDYRGGLVTVIIFM